MADRPKHILLIDDDPDIEHVIRVLLPAPQFRVDCRHSGPRGLEAMRADPPDLLLLDIMLASPSEGFHLCYEIRQDEALRHVPIVMISAIGARMGMDYAREIGSEYLPADAFLEKPLESALLRKTVLDLLRRQEALP